MAGPAVELELPAPTAWPMVLAAGVALMFAGLVTSVAVSLLGVVLAVAGSVGWFREVLPHPHEQVVTVAPEEIQVTTERREVERLPVAPEQVRAWLPVHTYSVSAGVRGGWVGSVWYPVNLLASVVYAQSVKLGPAELLTFHADSFAIAVLLHALGSTLVGVLYGAALPMFPRRPIVLGGLIAPILWSGALYSMLGLLNPVLQGRIDWLWFIASQIAFGVVAGLVVVRQSRIPTRENVAFALRAGVEAPGLIPPKHGEGGQT